MVIGDCSHINKRIFQILQNIDKETRLHGDRVNVQQKEDSIQ
jgi:hypothetical protein